MKSRFFLAAIAALLVAPVLATDYYVATNGNDGNPGTKADPFATIGAAVTAASGNSAMIFVADGNYTLSEEIPVAAPITITGESGNRDAVVVTANANSRAFALNHASATVSGITILGGNVADAGGNIFIGANGGIVRNCVVANGRGYYGGNIAMGKSGVVPPASALVVDCVISNGTDTATSSSWASAGNIASFGGRIQRCVIVGGYVQNGNGGGNVFLTAAAVLENCLITGGSGGNVNTFASGVAVNDTLSRVVNCTIVGNMPPAGGSSPAVWAWTDTDATVVVNCVIYGNGGKPIQVAHGKNVLPFVNCAFSSGGDNCADTVSPVLNLTDADFVKYADGDYRPVADGALFNAGDTDLYLTYATSATDLYSAKRIGKGIVDIGCYEAMLNPGLLIFVR